LALVGSLLCGERFGTEPKPKLSWDVFDRGARLIAVFSNTKTFLPSQVLKYFRAECLDRRRECRIPAYLEGLLGQLKLVNARIFEEFVFLVQVRRKQIRVSHYY
jgi:hypothetical protein